MGVRHHLWMPVVLAGCSIIYNPDNLPEPTDATEIDVMVDAPFDSNPELLDVTGVSPTTIDEGVGAGGGRPAVIVLEGTAIVGAAQVSVELMGSGETATLEGFDATPDGTRGGVIVRLPVMPDVDAGASATLRITITQGMVTRTQDVTVNGLDELTLSAATMDSGALAARYSQIEVTSNVHFTGTEPVVLRATAAIRFAARVDGDADGSTGGPHGCSGGVMEAAGACTTGGGKPGANATTAGLGAGGGGGGGGFGSPGTIASGAGAGDGGGVTGNDALVPIRSSQGQAGNRGNGGGGGGQGLLNAAGGAGGGGGGVLHVEAGGTIAVESMGAVRAQGATMSGGSGGGGGGAGGAILIRAGAAIESTTRWLSAPGGGASTGSQNAGGPGGAGRIRVDTPMGDVPSMADNPGALRGPSWGPTVPSLTTTSPLTVELRGQPGRGLDLRLNDQPVGAATPGINGAVEVGGVALRPGKNQLCAVALSGQLLPESLSCVELFYAGN